MRRLLVMSMLLAASWLPAAAVTGKVLGDNDKPLSFVKVCHFHVGVEQLCRLTDPDGTFSLPSSDTVPLRIVADGYLPSEVPAQGHQVVRLRRAPTLDVKLIDATTKQPIETGEVFVVNASAEKVGPFPANRNGVRISRILEPGEVRVLGRAERYQDSKPKTAELKPGLHLKLTLELTPEPQTDE